MRKSSWMVLSICGLLLACLGWFYVQSRAVPETLTREQANRLVQRMQDAVKNKNVGAIMDYIAPTPDTKIANLNHDQLRLMLARAFHAMQSPHADVFNVQFTGGQSEATLNFDLAVGQQGSDFNSSEYKGHVMLTLKRMEVSHLLGLYHTSEWRITGGTASGADLSVFGEE